MQFDRAIKIAFDGVDVEPVTNLRVMFDANKSDGEQLNKATITIFNLRASSRSALSKPRPLKAGFADNVISVLLYAGYEGNIKEIITGDIYTAHSTRIGTEWITVIEIYSGIAAATLGIARPSFNGKTKAKDIVDALVEPLGISIDYTQDALEALSGQTYSDFSDSGMSLRSANVFLKRFDLKFTIEENNKGLVYAENLPRRREEAVTEINSFNKNNGLIGSPNITRTGVEFIALLRPEIHILDTVFIQSQTINEALQSDEFSPNKYAVKNIRHFGDNRGDEWFTAIEAFYPDVLDGTYNG